MMKFLGDSSILDLWGENYFILKFLHEETSKAKENKQYGYAIAIYEKLLNLITEPDFNEEHYQIGMIRKYYAYTLASVGNFVEAINILRDLGILTRDIVRYFIELGDYDNALKEYEKLSTIEPTKDYTYIGEKDLSVSLFFSKRYDDALNVLNRERSELTEQLCLLGLLCLNNKYENSILEIEDEIEIKFNNLHNKILNKFNNWESAIINFHKKVTDKYDKFIDKIKLKPVIVTDANFEYNPDDVTLLFDRIISYFKSLRTLETILIAIDDNNIPSIRNKILKLINKNGFSNNVYFHDTIFELYILEENYSAALTFGKEKKLINISTQQDLYFKLLHMNKHKLKGEDIVYYKYLISNQSIFLQNNPDLYISYCQDKLNEFENFYKTDLLNYIYNKYSHLCTNEWPFYLPLSKISNSDSLKEKLKFLDFNNIPEFFEIINNMLDNAEALIRKLNNLPALGEGWITEAYVVNRLALLFDPIKVISQGSPSWLGNQRYDAYIPQLNLAVEFQGIQHYQPVEYFGGKENFLKTQRLDEYKRNISKINNTTIEYIRYDDNIDNRIFEIVNKYKLNEQSDI